MIQRHLNKILKLSSIIIMMITLSACGGGGQNALNSSSSYSSSQNLTSNSGSIIPVGNISVALSWTAPLTYEDSSPLNDLSGTNIYVKVNNGKYVLVASVKSASTVSYVIHNLSAGYTYTFAVTAFNSLGLESTFSSPTTIKL